MLKNLIYNKLLEQHKNRIYNYSFYMMKNRMDADDITQEVFIKIWDNIGKFKISSAKSWIMKTTHNLCIDYLRRKQTSVKRKLEIDDEMKDKIEHNDPMLNPGVVTEKESVEDKIKIAIQKLPESLKSVFVLYEIEELKYKEISKALNIPINSVKVYLMRARKRLQKELKEYEPA